MYIAVTTKYQPSIIISEYRIRNPKYPVALMRADKRSACQPSACKASSHHRSNALSAFQNPHLQTPRA
jgi:hypothetical protein